MIAPPLRLLLLMLMGATRLRDIRCSVNNQPRLVRQPKLLAYILFRERLVLYDRRVFL